MYPDATSHKLMHLGKYEFVHHHHGPNDILVHAHDGDNHPNHEHDDDYGPAVHAHAPIDSDPEE